MYLIEKVPKTGVRIYFTTHFVASRNDGTKYRFLNVLNWGEFMPRFVYSIQMVWLTSGVVYMMAVFIFRYILMHMFLFPRLKIGHVYALS